MTPSWTISGEDGHTLDAAARPADAVGLLGALLTLQSLDVDTLTWTQVRGIVPDDRQVISLYRDSIRVFHGIVTQRKYVYQGGSGSGYAFTASGALFRMSKAQIAEEATDSTGATAQRASFTFPPGDLKAMVSRLLDAAPGIVIGDIDEMFNVGRRTFSGGTWLSVLIELLKPVADVAGWVDYAGSSTPRLCIERRQTMETLRIQIGVDPVGRVELAPKSELQITGISLATASRDATGKLVYGRQSAGDGSQIVSVSGPEIGAFVPPDDLPTVTIQTVPITNSVWDAQVLSPMVAEAVANHGAIGWFPAGDSGLWTADITVGVNVSVADQHRLIAGQVMDFLKTDYGVVETKVRVRGWACNNYGSDGYSAAVAWLITQGYAFERHDVGGTDPRRQFIVWVDYEVDAINLPWADLTTLYAKAAYEYLTPPAGMADGMLAAANFVPYEGTVNLNPGFPWQRFISRRLNVLNADPGLASAGAIVQSAAVTLDSGAVALRCGAPLRVPLSSVLTRYSASSKDNIELV